jgi:CheY-like chemotaxis protein
MEQKRLASELYLSEVKTLILDKSNVHATMIQDYLRAFNLNTEIFTDEELAYDAIQSAFTKNKPYDLLIIDYDSPNEKGLLYCRKLKQNNWIDQSLKIIMFLPFNLDEAMNKIEQEGINLGLNKPIIPSVLFNGIIDLFRNDVYQKLNPTKVDDTSNLQKYHYNILLFEDNKTNQFIAQSILEQSGYSVKIVENGQIGVNEFRTNPTHYDIILMDLHMPIMNGFEASLEIRKLDQSIPIIAMTADAISGIEDQCKKVGINNFITKPFDPSILADKVYEFIENKDKKMSDDRNNTQLSSILDEGKGMFNVGNNKDLYLTILNLFMEESKNIMDNLQHELDKNDYEQAKHIVHKIKGSAGTIGATMLYETCIVFQKALSDKNDDLIKKYHPVFNKQLNDLHSNINKKLS